MAYICIIWEHAPFNRANSAVRKISMFLKSVVVRKTRSKTSVMIQGITSYIYLSISSSHPITKDLLGRRIGMITSYVIFYSLILVQFQKFVILFKEIVLFFSLIFQIMFLHCLAHMFRCLKMTSSIQ